MDKKPGYEDLEQIIETLEKVILTQKENEDKLLKENSDLKQTKKHYDTLMYNTEDFFLINDRNGTPQAFNESYKKKTEEILNIEIKPGIQQRKFTSNQAEKYWNSLHSRVLKGEKFVAEYTHKTKENRLQHFETLFCPIKEGQEIIGFTEITREITEHKEVEEELKKAHDELENRVKERTQELWKANEDLYEKTINLQDVNTALKVLLERRDKDKEENGEKVLLNVKELLIPYINKLKRGPLTESQDNYIELLESGLQDIISPFARRLTSRYMHITPRELEVANFVKEGKTSKEISEILNTTERTVVAHRINLRKKLGLDKKSNLRTYLFSLL